MYGNRERWMPSVVLEEACVSDSRPNGFPVGIVHGEGIGPEILDVCTGLLEAIESLTDCRFVITEYGHDLPLRPGSREIAPEMTDFCRTTFAQGGAVLCGAVGGRFVYSLRADLDLFCKIAPVVSPPGLEKAGIQRSEPSVRTDIIVVRENTGGLYQGVGEVTGGRGDREATFSFTYSETQIERIIRVAGRIATRRRGRVSLILKDGGVPAVSSLWREVAGCLASEQGFELQCVNVDYAAYHMLESPKEFDVIVAPNMFGDVIADLGGLLMASRGITYSGNFTPRGEGVYQTSHGAALDLAGRDIANPVGQVYSLAMLLRESFGLIDLAEAIEQSVLSVWAGGARTMDLNEPGCRIVGTREMGALITEELSRRLTATKHEAGTAAH